MLYDVGRMRDFGINLMIKAGLGLEETKVFVDSLLSADMRGIGSHGISRLRTYSTRVRSGVVTPEASVQLVGGTGSLISLDGQNGIGASIGLQTMDLCISRAKEHGCCFATVKNGNHFGIGAYYTIYATQQNMIGIVMANSEAAVVPVGGAKPMLGTNPLSVGVPANRYAPIVLDMATSTVARGKVFLAEKEGKKIPDNWCVDKNGVPTTDPTEALAGAMLPFGGAKGYAISLIIDILCSCLGGALDCRKTFPFWTDFEHPQNVGYFFGAIDVSKIVPVELFKDRIDTMIEEFKNCPPSPGTLEVLLPGEIEQRKYHNALVNGIELSAAVVDDLRSLAQEYSLENPFM